MLFYLNFNRKIYRTVKISPQVENYLLSPCKKKNIE